MPYDGSPTELLQHASVHGTFPQPKPLLGLIALWRAWRRRGQERQEAARWTERDLRDVGLTSADVWRELHRPLAVADAAPDPRTGRR